MNTVKQNVEEFVEYLESKKVEQAIIRLFVATDKSDWNNLSEVFNDFVELDYSSMTGVAGSVLSSKDIIAEWSAVLPGFDYTHHQIGNFIIEIEGDKAKAFCYGTATHFLGNKNENLWTVVGSYDFTLKRHEHQWKITAMRFNYKYQSGNGELVNLAIENAKK